MNGFQAAGVAWVVGVTALLVALQAIAYAASGRTLLDTGRALVEVGATRDGLRAVAAEITLAPANLAAQTYLLEVQDQACCRDDAELHEAVLAVVPFDRPVLDRLARLYERQGRFAEAAVLHMRTVPLTPDNPEFHARLFLYFELVGAADLARRSLIRYRQTGGDNLEILDRAFRRWAAPGESDRGAAPQLDRGREGFRLGPRAFAQSVTSL